MRQMWLQQSLDLFDTRFVRIRFIRLHFLLPKIRFVRMSLDLFEFSKKNSRFFAKMLKKLKENWKIFWEKHEDLRNTGSYCFLKSQVNFCLDFPNVFNGSWNLSLLRVSDCRRLFSDFHCSEIYEVPPLYYVYYIPICSNLIYSTFSRDGRLE